MHQAQQHAGVEIRSRALLRLDPQVQHQKSLVRQPHEDCNAERAADARYGEQRLHPFDVADAHLESARLFVDLRHAVGLDRLLDTQTYPMLVHIEEQQLLERCALFDRQLALDTD